jgi:molybdenum cofactor cytidylyltransferase
MATVQVAAVVPAAGFSTRFGAAKLLADLDGEPLIARTLASLLNAGIARIVVVTRERSGLERVDALADPRVTAAVNPDPARGMFSSIQVGLAAARGDVVLVLPADMPFVASATVAAVAAHAAATQSVVVPVYQGRNGHPLAIPAAVRDGLVALDPATTLKDALAAVGASRESLDVPDPGVLRDVDVPGDLAPAKDPGVRGAPRTPGS